MGVRGNAGVDASERSALIDDTRPEEITSIIPIDWADAPRWDSPDRRTPRRPLPADVTQDILIAECEFEDTADAHPFDLAETGYRTVEPPVRRPATQARPSRSGGRHRLAAPPSALKGRAALIAVAAGAAVVAATGHIDTSPATENAAPEAAAPQVNPAAAVTPVDPTVSGDSGVTAGTPAPDMHTFTDQLAEGDKLAKDAAEADRRARLPLFASPLPLGQYQFTSGFAFRWGAFHGGVDFAAPLGTPIHAATDGEVIEAGPASGFGNWIQIRAADGTVTMYGHMYNSGVGVRKGQHVTAGDVIGAVGSDGFSTGPHCHFEVWKDGRMKIDPMPWLAEHGVQMSNYTG
ncbi:M23 family metallopeptidase [Williamsia deligens]|uniref:M23 family metallopeptidase n=1 Tax=Williamsia deligens TaxID=321325 RepID=A0ABW3GC63_9NOCA|nr:M23 family metallopeptidase [Williamsia deligens]